MEQPAAGWTVRASKPFREKKLTDRLWVPPRFIFSAYIERGVKFITYFCLVLRLKMTASTTPLHLYTFMTWTVTTLPLYFTFSFSSQFFWLPSCCDFSVYPFPFCLSHFLFISPIHSYPFYDISLQNYGPAFLNSETYSAE
jgi:hypothetical protein